MQWPRIIVATGFLTAERRTAQRKCNDRATTADLQALRLLLAQPRGEFHHPDWRNKATIAKRLEVLHSHTPGYFTNGQGAYEREITGQERFNEFSLLCLRVQRATLHSFSDVERPRPLTQKCSVGEFARRLLVTRNSQASVSPQTLPPRLTVQREFFRARAEFPIERDLRLGDRHDPGTRWNSASDPHGVTSH